MNARLIVNPGAGGAEQARPLLERADERATGMLETVTTERAEDVERLAAEAIRAGFDRIIVAGGDGTMSRAVNGLAADFDACELAIVPTGTANDLARNFSLPEDPDEALRLAWTGRSMRIDLIRYVQGERPPRHFVNAATGGFSRADEETIPTQNHKGEWGSLAYLRSALDRIGHIPEFEMELHLDEDPPLRARGSALAVANGRYAGGLPLIPAADPNDHRLEIVAITAADLLTRLKLLGQFLLGHHLEAEAGLIHRRSNRLTVHAEPAMRFSTDGEPIGETPVRFEIIPEALRLVVP
jgi:diacylglycerol kinase (ATP)